MAYGKGYDQHFTTIRLNNKELQGYIHKENA